MLAWENFASRAGGALSDACLDLGLLALSAELTTENPTDFTMSVAQAARGVGSSREWIPIDAASLQRRVSGHPEADGPQNE